MPADFIGWVLHFSTSRPCVRDPNKMKLLMLTVRTTILYRPGITLCVGGPVARKMKKIKLFCRGYRFLRHLPPGHHGHREKRFSFLKRCSACIAIAFAAVVPGALAQHLVLKNPLSIDRPQEVVEVPLRQVLDHLHFSPAQASSLVAEDAVTGQRIPDQLYGSRPDAEPDLLLLLVHLPSRSVQRIAFRLSPNSPQLPPSRIRTRSSRAER